MNATIEETRDTAMGLVERNANEAVEDFSERAADYVLHTLQAGPATGEELTDACKAASIVPHNDKAFGPVYMRLARSGRIKKVGFAARKKGNLTAGANLWAAA